ncbi:2' O-ribose methyltransferase [Blastocladiella emersonii ATCC 22665]|nr:2' O-ribose methyltransferase [Blastocladiella emersonii ATCC 22665]
MGGAGKSRAWMNRHVKDAFVRRAREEGLQSRAAFKLKELHHKHRLLRPGSVVVDCGAAPGGWTQVAAGMVRAPTHGLVVAVDLLPLDPPIHNALFLQRDFTLPETQATIREVLERFHERRRRQSRAGRDDGEAAESEQEPEQPPRPAIRQQRRLVDVVLSDMAPSFSGNKSLDRLRTVGLAESALEFALPLLKPGGHFACKILQGPEANELRARLKRHFEEVAYEKPKSSRSESSEGFLVGIKFVVPPSEGGVRVAEEQRPRGAEEVKEVSE